MLLSAVSVLVVAQSISEIPEALMNNPVSIYSRIPPKLVLSVYNMASALFWTQPRLTFLVNWGTFRVAKRPVVTSEGCCSVELVL